MTSPDFRPEFRQVFTKIFLAVPYRDKDKGRKFY